MSAPRSRSAIAAAAVLGLGLTLVGPAAATAAEPVAKPRHSKAISNDSKRLQQAVKPKKIMKHLRQLQVVADRYGDRAAGTEGYNASSRYVESQLRRAGYQPRRQYFDFTYTEVLDKSLNVEGTEIENKPMTGTSNTDGPLTGPLVQPDPVTGCAASDWSGIDATDSIALISRGGCTFAAKSANAKAAGAMAAVIYNNADGDLNGTLGGSSPDYAPTTGITQADGQALVAGLPSEATLNLDIFIEERRSWNVIAETRKGRKHNVVMAGSHLDSVQHGPGINDNGTGSATLLETAIQLKKQEKKLRNKVRFAWWGAEELGLLGSTHYVNDLVERTPGALDDIATYLNYDMVGSPNYRIGVYDANQSGEPTDAPIPAGSIETERAFRKYFRAKGQPVVDTAFSGRSDYQAFIENGVAAGGLFTGADGTKTADEVELFGGRTGITYDPNYHTPGDNYRNVNRRAVNIMSNAIAHMTITLGKSTRIIDTPSAKTRKRHVRAGLPEGVTRR